MASRRLQSHRPSETVRSRLHQDLQTTGLAWSFALVRTQGSRALLIALGGILLLGCGDAPPPITACEPGAGLEPVCGFWDPEDLALLPGGEWLLVSQFGPGFGEESPGSLTAFRPSDGARRALYPEGGSATRADGVGDPECPGAPGSAAFGPHGIDLTADGRTLYLVNHAPREAIEIFEVGRTPDGPTLTWQGCVPLREGDMANDVAAHPGGGFVATRFMSRDSFVDQLKLLAGWITGQLMRWTPDSGWSDVPDSQASGPNGIAISADGQTYYTTAWGGQDLIRLAADGSGRREVPLGMRGDNLTWARDGRLLATGQRVELAAMLACGSREEGTCAIPFSVLAIDPETLATEVLLDHDPASVAGAGSVAVDTGEALWIGSFGADRLVRMARP